MKSKTKKLLEDNIESFKKRISDKRKGVDFNNFDKNSSYLLAVECAYDDAKRALKGITKTPEMEKEKNLQ